MVEHGGRGDPLVLVHGTGADASRWSEVLPLLTPRFRVYALNRRGRGESGDEPEHALAWEGEDIASALAALPVRAHLVAHSYGAICALEAALRDHANLRTLTVYEPPIATPGQTPHYPADAAKRYREALARGEKDEVVASFLQEVAGVPREAVEGMRHSPAWPGRVALAPTIAREMAAEHDYELEPRRLAKLQVPTQVLLGSESPPFIQAACQALTQALPHGRLVELRGQGHVAMQSAPKLFADAVQGFCQAHSADTA